MKELQNLKVIPEHVRAFETTFNTFLRQQNTLVTTVILIEKDVLNNAFIAKLDFKAFNADLYNKDLMTLDIIRLVMQICFVIAFFVHLVQDFIADKTNSFSKKSLIFIKKTIRPKLVFILASSIFLIISILLKYNQVNELRSYFDNDVFFDFYSNATGYNAGINTNTLSMFLLSLYLISFTQYITYINQIFLSLKKIYLELFFLISFMFLILLAFALLCRFVYGNKIFVFQDLKSSFIMSLKIFLFMEYTFEIKEMINANLTFTTIFFISLTIFFKYFLLNLFIPIFIEFYRREQEKYEFSNKTEKLKDYGIVESK